MKKWLSFLIALSLMTGLCAASFADGYTCGDYKYIVLRDGTAEITDYHGTNTSLEIPEELNGYTVTSIGDRSFFNNFDIAFLSIAPGVTNIGEEAFFACSLGRVIIPGSVKSIGEGAFKDCYTLLSVEIGDGVPSIPDYAFSDCSCLISVKIPNSVRSIGERAFLRCLELSQITIPDRLESIGDYAFFACQALDSIRIPDSVTKCGHNPFAKCRDLKEIIVSSGNPSLATIDGVLFNKKSKCLISYPPGKDKNEYSIPDGILTIGTGAFYGGKKLTSIVIPDSVTRIEDYAFADCYSLASITIPGSVKSIGEDVFYNESGTSVSAIVVRGSYAEQYCRKNGIPCVYQESAPDWLH